MKYRNPYLTGIFSSITLGLYHIYWVIQTKNEINKLGGKIPSIIFYLILYIYYILKLIINLPHIEKYFLIFPLFFWYKYITYFVKNILYKDSVLVKLKYFLFSISLPITVSLYIPVLNIMAILFISNIKESLLELAQYLANLQSNTEIFISKAILFLIIEWLLFSVTLFILLIPQIIIQHYLNKLSENAS